MKKRKHLSVKDRLTIRIKATRSLPWWFHGYACVLLFCVLILMGLRSGKKETVQAPEVLTAKSNQVRITVIGEMKISDEIRVMANKKSYGSLLQNLQSYWADSDYVLAAAAGPVLTYDVSHYTSTREKNEESVYLRPAALRGFSKAGVTGLCLATDDVYNYGIAGIQSTIREMEKSEMEYLGVAASSGESFYRFLTFDGKNADNTKQTRAVAVFGVNDVIREHSSVRENRAGIVNSSMAELYQLVNEAANAADLTIVYLHSGEQNDSTVTEDQKVLAHALIDSGADVVVNTHSHMVQPMERYHDGLILYGIGDVFSTEDYSFLLHSAMLDVAVNEDGEICAYVTPLHIENGIPSITDNSYYRSVVTRKLTSEMLETDYSLTEDGKICVPLGKLPENAVYQPNVGALVGASEVMPTEEQN